MKTIIEAIKEQWSGYTPSQKREEIARGILLVVIMVGLFSLLWL